MGNAYQSGFPDLFATHPIHGMRWIEVKLPGMIGSKFTNAQKKFFPIFSKFGTGIWILTSDSELELNKLFSSPNCKAYFIQKGHAWHD